MQNVVLIGLLVNVLNRHLRIEVFIEIRITLLVVIDRSLSQIPLTTVFQILVAAFFKGKRCPSRHFDLFHRKNPPHFYIKILDTSSCKNT